MAHDHYSDALIRRILTTMKTIAMVGASPSTNRPSYFVYKYLTERSYKVIPINPGRAGEQLLGQTIYARLADVPVPVDMVEIFRPSEYAPAIVAEALAMTPRPKVIWMQLGVRNDAAAATAEAEGLTVIMNRCPKIEFGRLSSEISWIGVNSRTISSKRPPAPVASFQKMTLNRPTFGEPSTPASAPKMNVSSPEKPEQK